MGKWQHGGYIWEFYIWEGNIFMKISGYDGDPMVVTCTYQMDAGRIRIYNNAFEKYILMTKVDNDHITATTYGAYGETVTMSRIG